MRVTAVRLGASESTGRAPRPELAAILYLPDPAGPTAPGLVVGHGAGSRKERHDAFCREACAQGFAVLALDLRGHGDSMGAADGPLEADIVAAADFLRHHPAVDGRRLCYRGSSMGGFYGLKAAAEGVFTAVALVCPAGEQVMLDGIDDFEARDGDTEGDQEQPAVKARWDLDAMRTYFRKQDSRTTAAQVSCPVLLVHARGDEVVPFEDSLALAGRLRGDVTLFAPAGGSHTSAQHDPDVHRATVRWLMDQVKSACTGRT